MPLKNAKDAFEDSHAEAMDWLRQEIATLRSGQVKPDIVTNLQVEAYGSRSPLQSIASILSSDARTLIISPYDKNMIRDIEKAITAANLGVQPTVDSEVIRLTFPSLTEEVREQTIRLLHNKAEEAKVRMRQGRDEALKSLKQEKEKSTITEDDFYTAREELDKLISKANDEIAGIIERKEKEISTI